MSTRKRDTFELRVGGEVVLHGYLTDFQCDATSSRKGVSYTIRIKDHAAPINVDLRDVLRAATSEPKP